MTRGLVPFAKHKLIAPGENDPRIKPVANAFHVAVSHAASLHDFFENDGGIESHGYILADGSLEQYRNCLWEADAQSLGNSWYEGGTRVGVLSWESEGMGEGEWTDAQLETIKRLIRWSHDEFGIPIQKIQAWNGSGNGYHCQFPQWNPDNHSCPGPDRVKQFNNIIVPWMNQGGQEDDMPSIDDIVKHVWGTRFKTNDHTGREKDNTRTASEMLAQTHARAGDARRLSGRSLQILQQVTDLIANNKLTDDDKARIAKNIADEVKLEIGNLNAADIAQHLDVTFKE